MMFLLFLAPLVASQSAEQLCMMDENAWNIHCDIDNSPRREHGPNPDCPSKCGSICHQPYFINFQGETKCVTCEDAFKLESLCERYDIAGGNCKFEDGVCKPRSPMRAVEQQARYAVKAHRGFDRYEPSRGLSCAECHFLCKADRQCKQADCPNCLDRSVVREPSRGLSCAECHFVCKADRQCKMADCPHCLG